MSYLLLGRVSNVAQRSPDATAICEPEELAAAWLEIEVPVEELPAEARRCCENDAIHAQRLTEVGAWAQAVGGWAPALATAPLLLRWLGLRLEILDGWHRLAAARAHGQSTVRALLLADHDVADIPRAPDTQQG